MIVTAILVGLAANIDNLTVGIAYGVQQRVVRLVHNLLIAATTTAVTCAALMAGRALHRHVLSMVPNWISGLMLILFAVAGLLRPGERSAEAGCIGAPEWREVVFLAVTLSINNIGLAIAGGFAGLGYGSALTSVFGFSIALLSAGQFVGQRASRRIADTLRQDWIGSFILLAAGVMMLSGL